MSSDYQIAKEKFREVWGYRDFRHPQGEIVKTLLQGRDALIILPTGGGKSICFQLPALLQQGLTIVVSPLVALMENQVRQLKNLGLPGALLHSELTKGDRNYTLQAIEQQKLSLLYLSPETLLSPTIWEILTQPEIKITGLVIDEVHCLTQWGTTFRPAYRRLGAVRRSLLQTKPPGTKIAIAAFTATAAPQTQQEIIKVLELKNPANFLVGPYRANLSLKVKTIWTPQGRKQEMLKFIRARKNNSGLVYVRSRRDSQSLAQWFNSLGFAVEAYHAGLITNQRRKIEQAWISGKLQFVICTSAFGMGIDKADVGWVVHFHAPELLAEYIQEVGRAGRNGELAHTLTLISEPTGWLNPEDKQRSRFFQQHLEKQYRTSQQLAKELPLRGSINTIKEQFKEAEATLGILHSLDAIAWSDPFHYRQKSTAFNVASLVARQRSSKKQMQHYLKTKQCRWQYLLQAFGFQPETSDFKCDRCDNCRSI